MVTRPEQVKWKDAVIPVIQIQIPPLVMVVFSTLISVSRSRLEVWIVVLAIGLPAVWVSGGGGFR
jgi:hypothetical protein